MSLGCGVYVHLNGSGWSVCTPEAYGVSVCTPGACGAPVQLKHAGCLYTWSVRGVCTPPVCGVCVQLSMCMWGVCTPERVGVCTLKRVGCLYTEACGVSVQLKYVGCTYTLKRVGCTYTVKFCGVYVHCEILWGVRTL